MQTAIVPEGTTTPAALAMRVLYSFSRTIRREPLGCLTAAAATVALIVAWDVSRPVPHSATGAGVLLALTTAVAVSRLFAIRIGNATRIYIASVPIYLLCTLFTPAYAATAVGIGMLVRELSICRECNNSPGTVGAQVGRWMLVALVVSAVMPLWPAEYYGFGACFAVFLLWAGDVLTFPLVYAPLTGMRPMSIIKSVGHQSFVGELMQYFVGMVALVLIDSGILGSGIIWLDIACTQMIVLPMILLYMYLKNEDKNSTAAH